MANRKRKWIIPNDYDLVGSTHQAVRKDCDCNNKNAHTQCGSGRNGGAEAQCVACSARDLENETSRARVLAVTAFCSSRDILEQDIHTNWLRTTQPFIPSGVDKSSNSFGWGYGGNIASVGWQVKLCDPISYVSSRSAETTVDQCPRV